MRIAKVDHTVFSFRLGVSAASSFVSAGTGPSGSGRLCGYQGDLQSGQCSSPPVVAVRFGQGISSTERGMRVRLEVIVTQLPLQLVAMDSRGSAHQQLLTALAFYSRSMSCHRGFDSGVSRQAGATQASTKGSQISPRFAEVVIKQPTLRARKGVTTALLKAAGYGARWSSEFAGVFQDTLQAGHSSPDLM